MEITAKERRLIIIIVCMVAATFLLLIAGWFFNRSTLGPSLNKLSATESEALRINELAQKRSPDLAASQVQANVGAILGSDLADLDLERQKVTSQKKVPAAITKSVTNEDAKKQLDDAEQRSDLTHEYQSLMSEALDNCLTAAREARAAAKRDNLKQLLDKVIEHLQTLQGQVDELV